jgi:hypothetical protein
LAKTWIICIISPVVSVSAMTGIICITSPVVSAQRKWRHRKRPCPEVTEVIAYAWEDSSRLFFLTRVVQIVPLGARTGNRVSPRGLDRKWCYRRAKKNKKKLDCCQIIILSIYVPSTHAYAHVLRLSLDLPYEKR